MTPAELHSRILLHELRTILLDETREGGPIPQKWKDYLLESPHEKDRYLILADWLDDEGDQLGELCRIQVELIGLLPVDLLLTENYSLNEAHPFHRDATAVIFGLVKSEHRTSLLTRRFHIVRELYAKSSIDTREHRLGRTTRMLTDILRYCALNQGKHILCQIPNREQPYHWQVFYVLLYHLFDHDAQLAYGTTPRSVPVLENTVHFTDRLDNVGLIRTHRMNTITVQEGETSHDAIFRQLREAGFNLNLPYESSMVDFMLGDDHEPILFTQTISPDITFTDHACLQTRETAYPGGPRTAFSSVIHQGIRHTYSITTED